MRGVAARASSLALPAGDAVLQRGRHAIYPAARLPELVPRLAQQT